MTLRTPRTRPANILFSAATHAIHTSATGAVNHVLQNPQCAIACFSSDTTRQTSALQPSGLRPDSIRTDNTICVVQMPHGSKKSSVPITRSSFAWAQGLAQGRTMSIHYPSLPRFVFRPDPAVGTRLDKSGKHQLPNCSLGAHTVSTSRFVVQASTSVYVHEYEWPSAGTKSRVCVLGIIGMYCFETIATYTPHRIDTYRHIAHDGVNHGSWLADIETEVNSAIISDRIPES
ncbi:hypothetical protein C8Q80DRAFT_736163 [Daedaleopsis nitida]|nr:hypothetical protein C8Q80DRAFT_736163 [Daedaleopsis nitida]